MVNSRIDYQHEHYERNREKKRLQSKEMRESWSDEYRLWRGSKQSATKRNLLFTLNVEDIIIPERCIVFNIPLLRSGRAFNSVSIDRIDNTKGYTKDNIQLISRRANRLKADASLEDISLIYKYMSDNLERV